LWDLLGQCDGLLNLLPQGPDLGQGLGEATVGNLGLFAFHQGASLRLQIDDVVAGANDLGIGVDQVGHILAGGNATGYHARVELESTGLNALHPLDNAIESLEATQGDLQDPVGRVEQAEVLYIAIGNIDQILRGILVGKGHYQSIYLEFEYF